MRRSLTIPAVVFMLMGALAAPAAADDPVVFRDQTTFEDYDVCTGELMTITIYFLVSIHDHEDEFNVRVRRTGETSAGYVMTNGKEVFVASDGTESGEFSDPWVNPATGAKMEAQGRFLAVDREVLVDEFRLVCKTGPTIWP